VIAGEATPPDTADPTTGRGPQARISCPAGAIAIAVGQDVPASVDAQPAGTAFCLAAGTHTPARPIHMKRAQQLVGQYGAVIDGANVSTDDGTSVVSGWNCADCAGVTVRNLVIRGRETISCVGAYGVNAASWKIENNEISGCRWGINIGRYWEGTAATKPYVAGPTVSSNYIHHNVWTGASSTDGSGAYGVQNTSGMSFVNNELAYNGGQPKFTGTTGTRVADNFIHHNPVGVWFDGDNLQATVENNLLEDQSSEGVFYEISASGVIRNNTIRRSGTTGIYVSTSRDMDVYGNVLEDNWRDLSMFANCPIIGGPDYPYPTAIGFDLRNNSIHDNTVRVGTRQDTIAATLSVDSSCTATQVATYMNPDGGKNNRFSGNHYIVPSLSGTYWVWDAYKVWSGWQALGMDTTGTVALP
jgi:parallel beta-helix repeat protein